MEKRPYLACSRPQRDGTAVGKSMQIVSQKHRFYCAIKRELHGKSNGFPLFFV